MKQHIYSTYFNYTGFVALDNIHTIRVTEDMWFRDGRCREWTTLIEYDIPMSVHAFRHTKSVYPIEFSICYTNSCEVILMYGQNSGVIKTL